MTREEQLSRLVMAAEPRPFWLDQPGAPPARDPLRGEAAADLVVIGGGFTGLWTALAQRAEIGWRNRQGIGYSGNQFHYYRLTADDRILWGGYDAIYHFGRGIRAAYDQRPATFAALAAHFFTTFPQLEGIRFSHRWGGVIDTCSRFCAFYGTAQRGRAAYALGFTGLGVGASRFGARVMLDLLSGEPTELTRLRLVRSKPVPFPPEPLAYLGIHATRWSLARADRRGGRRNLWLRALDTAGLGFDS
jgi:glycine/D-amino acid oxidase-like deaminating enzyme